MDISVKKYIMGLMNTGGHKHTDMIQTIQCSYCGVGMKKAEAEYNRLRRQKPELFIRKQPEYPDSPEVQKNLEMLSDRLKKDKLYQKHIQLLAKGTPEERKKEEARAVSGYYKKHHG